MRAPLILQTILGLTRRGHRRRLPHSARHHGRSAWCAPRRASTTPASRSASPRPRNCPNASTRCSMPSTPPTPRAGTRSAKPASPEIADEAHLARPPARLAAARRARGQGHAGADALRRGPPRRPPRRRWRLCAARGSRTQASGTTRRSTLAEHLLHAANAGGPTGRYQLEAAIQSAHTARRLGGIDNWPAIVRLYDHLLALTGSPVVALNRAVALAEIDGPDAALAALAPLAADKRMHSYQPYWAARGHLLARDRPTARAPSKPSPSPSASPPIRPCAPISRPPPPPCTTASDHLCERGRLCLV